MGRRVDHLIPRDGRRAEFDADAWIDKVQQGENGGMYLQFISDLIGPEMAGINAVYLRTSTEEESSRMLSFLARTGLRSLVIVDPFRAEEMTLAQLGPMSIAFVKADPLEFLSQIDPGPSVMFHPVYRINTADQQQALCPYYNELAVQILRVVSNSRNLSRGPGFRASGHPIATGYDNELFHQMVPQDRQPEEWNFHVNQVVLGDENELLALAASAKEVPGL